MDVEATEAAVEAREAVDVDAVVNARADVAPG